MDDPLKPQDIPPLPPDTEFAYTERLEHMRRHCIECGACVRECEFLRRWGTPWRIAGRCLDGEDISRLPFECSLCGLCRAVCPLDLAPGAMFLDMRRQAVRSGLGRFSTHNRLLAYEKRGASPLFSWYGLPGGCDTVFFPGCTFTGTRPAVTRMLFAHLRSSIPNLGVVLDCCAKPCHDLGRERRFESLFPEMRRWLVEHGVRRVVVNCPNCYKVFNSYGDPIRPVSVYEHLAEHGLPHEAQTGALNEATIHDPCPLRDKETIHQAARDVAGRMGITIREMEHHGRETICCGEGGTVAGVEPELSSLWGSIRRKESGGRLVLTYCAGCVGYLGERMPAAHVLDAVFTPREALAGKARVSKAPMTYLHRLRLKAWFKRHLKTTHQRTRPDGLIRY